MELFKKSPKIFYVELGWKNDRVPTFRLPGARIEIEWKMLINGLYTLKPAMGASYYGHKSVGTGLMDLWSFSKKVRKYSMLN
jgi:hypothetical protein